VIAAGKRGSGNQTVRDIWDLSRVSISLKGEMGDR
jgi:hypothetical protein